MSVFICCCFHFPLLFYLNQNEACFLDIDKQAFVYSHSDVDDSFDSCGSSLLLNCKALDRVEIQLIHVWMT